MKKHIISSVLILMTLIIICGCTTNTTTPVTTATTSVPYDTTTTSTVTAETTWTSITYKSQMYEFMVEVYTGWDWEFVPGGVGFFADGKNWSTEILSSEIDSVPTLSELEQDKNVFIDDFFDGFNPEDGYGDFKVVNPYTTSSMSVEYTSSELHFEFTFNLDGTEMWGFLYSIYTGDRHYQIVRICVNDRFYVESYLHESNQFYWTFIPSYIP